MKNNFSLKVYCFVSLAIAVAGVQAQCPSYPADGARDVPVDAHLIVGFDGEPCLGAQGRIKVYEANSRKIVDELDISIPAGPTEGRKTPEAIYTPVPYDYSVNDATNRNTTPGTPSGKNVAEIGQYQLNIIGHFTDGFHFHPVLLRGNKAVVYLHNNMLDYGREYVVEIDASVFGKPLKWHFFTRKDKPKDIHNLVVSSDGTADFCTVQGAVDAVPEFCNETTDERWRVYVRNGDYEEIVYFRNKHNLTIEGESRDGVRVHYANNEVFNPHPINIKTNEWPGTFPSRRAAFMSDNGRNVTLRNMTIATDLKGQAEGLLMMGEGNRIENVHIIGDGDALQINGTTVLDSCEIDGGGDTVLGRGPALFRDCVLRSYGAFVWIRNTEENHGDVFLRCRFVGLSDYAEIARSPINKGVGYPFAEAVLIDCTLENIPERGWGEIGGDPSHVHFWEYNSVDASGKPVDISSRHPLSRQLSVSRDYRVISDYSSLDFVWSTKSTIYE